MNEKDYVLQENVSRTLGKDAQRNNILAAKIVAEIVKTTLGPKGMDKMLVDSSGNITVTNDGVTILEEIELEHPAAKMMVEIAKTQEAEVGDGTTTAVMLAGKLLENAEKLLEKKIHPTLIAKGYKIAALQSLSILQDLSLPINNKQTLHKIATTAMTGKVAEGNKEQLAALIVEAVNQIAEGTEINSNDIKIQKIRGGSIADSELIQGVILNKERVNIEMPQKITNNKILLLDFPIEIKNPETETKISISTPEQLENFIASEENYLKNLVEKIRLKGITSLFCQKGIDDLAQYYLAKAGIFACRRVSKSDMEILSRATGAKIISNIEDLSDSIIGTAELVEEVKEGNEKVIYVKGCKNPKAVTIALKGGSEHMLDEVERAVKDGLGDVITAVKSGKIVAGGGAIEVELARRLRTFAATIQGREQLAIEEFANAIEIIPEALAENAGLDQIEILTELKRKHEAGYHNHGINLLNEKIEDTFEAGIIEPLKVKTQAISAASEVATLILRIDDVLISKSSKDTQPEILE